jgi:hypothetical protein
MCRLFSMPSILAFATAQWMMSVVDVYISREQKELTVGAVEE